MFYFVKTIGYIHVGYRARSAPVLHYRASIAPIGSEMIRYGTIHSGGYPVRAVPDRHRQY
jgi:hypothetical protein